MNRFASIQPYELPVVLQNAPTHRLRVHRITKFAITDHSLQLGNFPTPIQPWSFKVNDKEFSLLIKRDDLSDLTASGNKIRKLEFILPEVIQGSYDWVVSIGGTQSNHCRAVSAVCARLGIPSAHVLRKDYYYNEEKPSEGNLLLHKLFGAELSLVSKEEYLSKGKEKLLEEAGERLKENYGAKKPFLLLVGGSTVHGAFGYIEFMRELEAQLQESGEHIDEIIFSAGSGGTATGLAVGKYISTSPVIKNVKLTGYTACDTPEWFHGHVNEMLHELGLGDKVKSEDLINFVQSKGIGYAVSSPEELQTIRDVARSSGIILDCSYTGKAIHGFVKEGGRDENVKCLFVHTGGLFSIFGQEELLLGKK